MRIAGPVWTLLFLAQVAAQASGLGGAYEDSPDGLSDLRALAEAEGFDTATLLTTATYLEPPAEPTLLVITAPQRAITQTERDAVRSFVNGGGALLVADDQGPGADLAAEFGIQYDRVPVYGFNQTNRTVPSPSRVVATAQLGGETLEIHLDLPTGLRTLGSAPEGSRPIAWTQPGAYADLDGDGEIDADDLPGPFTVAVLTQPGSSGGRALFVADSGVLLNGLSGSGENEAFARSILHTLLPSGGLVIFDEAHRLAPAARAGTTPTSTLIIVATRQPYQSILATAAVGMLAWSLFRLRGAELWGRHSYNPDTILARPEGSTPTAGEIRSLLVDALPAELRGLASGGPGDAARLERRLGDPALARFLVGDRDPEPSEIVELLDAFDKWIEVEAG